MIRQENTIPIFTYENEGEGAMYTERGQGGKRNPYLMDYAAQRRQQGGREKEGIYSQSMSRRSEQDNGGRKRSAEAGNFVRTSRLADFRGTNAANQRTDVDVLIYPSCSAERAGGRSSQRSAERNGGRSPQHSAERAGGRSPQRFAEGDRGMRLSQSAEKNRSVRQTYSAEEGGAKRLRRPQESNGTAQANRYAESVPLYRPCRSAKFVDDHRPAPSAASRAPRRPAPPTASGESRNPAPSAASRASRRPAPPTASGASRRPAAVQHSASARRKKHALMQRIAVFLWAVGILVLAGGIMLKDGRISSAKDNQEDMLPAANIDENNTEVSGLLVQGLPAEDFARHPEWTENLLTPNEYSRPGDALETVTNIFVHYTANPGTSAIQNRSYFEQQKDTHERSVSAHFIIGYEGEIIQCVPLDEIAYAVATRNSDSISIECCFLNDDGSFTQETYDSLIALLAWLIDVYDLDSNDILRHYDCGGKKCPLYYTEHPGEWEQLKKDVDKL